jgi:HME family heavy-metal exporter
MFAFLVRASLRCRVLVLITTAALMAYGGVLVSRLPIDVLPPLNKGMVTIVTESPGLAPEEVETLVTTPIEASMNGATGVTRVRSSSVTGLSLVDVEFDWDTDIFRDRQIVTERLAPILSELPPGVEPLLAPVGAIMGEIMLVALSGEHVDPMQLREISEWTVARQLRALPGVSRVVPIGGEIRQYRITPDVMRMNQLDVSFGDLEKALASFGSNSGGGFVEQNDQEFLIRNLGRTKSLEDLRNLVIDRRAGQPVLLRQLADASFEPRQRRGMAGFMGRSAVVLSVQKQPDADTVVLTAKVEKTLAGLQQTMPEGVEVNKVMFRQADFIESSVDNVVEVLIEAIAVVAVILFLFLLNVRTTAISLTAIPVSVLITFIVFHWMGLTINTMTLGGLAIAIGELVDDAVVDVENIFRRLKQNRTAARPRPLLEIIADASQEVRSGIVYSTIIIVLVFVPLFAIPGIEGRLFAPLGVAYIVSILASLLTSITLTPVMCSYLLSRVRRLREGESFVVRTLKRVNGRMLAYFLERPRPVLVAVGLAVTAAASIVPALPRAFLPPFNEGSFIIVMTLDPGVSLDETDRFARVVEGVLRQVPEVVQVGHRTGRAEADDHANGVNVADIEVKIQRSSRPLKVLMADMRSRLAGVPATFEINQPITHRLVDHILTGTRGEIVVKIFGSDLDTIRNIAGDVERRMLAIPGLEDVALEKQLPVPQLRIQLDPQRALLYGVKPGDLVERLAHLTSGTVVSQIIDGIKHFDVVVRLSDRDRQVQELGELLIDTPEGHVHLSRIADVFEATGPNAVMHENGQRRILVTANGDGSHNNLIASEVARMVANLNLPTGYFATFEGVYAEQMRSVLRLAGLGLASLALMFAILYTRYRSAVLALIIMVNVPLALIGSVIALKVAHVDLSIASMIGFITLTGISTRNGILKVSHYINLVLREGERFGAAMIIRGSQERLVPVLMTATSAGLALFPLLFQVGHAGKEILHPVAVVIFGGLISATMLDAVVTPLLFYRYGRGPLERLAEGRVSTRPAEAY